MRVRSLTVDLVLVTLATIVAVCLRDNFNVSDERINAVFPYLAITLVIAAVALPGFGVVRTVWRFTSMPDYLRIISATGTIIVGALALGFVFNRLDGIARTMPVLQGLLIVTFLVGARVGSRVRHAPRARLNQSPVPADAGKAVIVVGLNKLAELYLQCVAEFSSRSRVAGILDPCGHVGTSLLGHRVLGAPEQIADVLRDLEVHGVFVDRIVVTLALDSLAPTASDALRAVAASSDVSLEFVAEKMGFDQRAAGPGEQPACEVADPASEEQVFAFTAADALAASPYKGIKRGLDLVAALALLVVLSPVLVSVGILVAFDAGLPIFFWQQRPGLGGHPFRVYKFRTMGAAHDVHGRRRSDADRISAIGSFLRRTRLDELPQLFSILAGHMSFVGPRPLLPVDQSAAYSARLLVRPGLTGWAQIKGGRTISAIDKAALDVWYVHNVSFALDVKILLATIPIVLFGERVTHQSIVQAWRDLHAAGIYGATDLTPETVLVLSDR